jgi:hypothetical protein
VSDILLVFGIPIIAGGLLAWTIIQLDPKRRARRATARAAAATAAPAAPRTWIDIAAQAWVAGQIARLVVFLIGGAALLMWWYLSR